MIEGQEKMKDEGRGWQFWFFVSFSLLLIVTFVYYLPLRFEHAVSRDMEDMHGEGDKMMQDVHEEHGKTIYHEEQNVREGLVVNLNVTPVPIFTNQQVRLDFFVNQKPGNVPVGDLEVEHERLMHVIGVRNDMNEFFHIHPFPTYENGLLSIDHVFQKPGRYKIWSEVKKDGITHTFGHPEIVVGGEGIREEKQVSYARNLIVGEYQIALRLDEPVARGHEHELLFDVHTLDSHEAELDAYLGELMHLAIIKDDWKYFLHTHPTGVKGEDHQGLSPLIQKALANGGGHDTTVGGHGVGFRVMFPEPGLYKVFAQFRSKGSNLPLDEAVTAGFWIKVEEKTPFLISSWWINLIVSLLLIIILSIGVSRFLQIKQ